MSTKKKTRDLVGISWMIAGCIWVAVGSQSWIVGIGAFIAVLGTAHYAKNNRVDDAQ